MEQSAFYPTVSVIVPIFNTGKYLSKCISSILNQTYKSIEIILIDDGSQDNSLEICKKYQSIDSRIQVIHEGNHGVSATRNLGIKRARGRYITFVDSDDYLDNCMIEKLMNSIRINKTNLSICGYFEFNNKIGHTPKKVDNNLLTGKINKDYHLFLSTLVSIAGPTVKLYSKEIIDKYKILFDDDITNGEDQIFNFKYYTHVQNYSYVPECLYYYRKGNNNSLSSVTTYRSAIDGYLFRKRLKRFLVDNDVLFKEEILSLSCITYFHRHILLSDRRNSYTEFKKRAKKINELLKGYYSYKTIKWVLLFSCLKHDIYILPYCYYRLRSII